MSPFHREKNWGTEAPDFCITLELASGKAEVTLFWILGVGFSPPIQQPLICTSKSTVKPAPCLSSSCPRMRRSKACHVILQLRNQLLLSLNHLSRRQGGQQTLILFWSWPATGCLTFCKSLNCSVTLCEMRMEELWSVPYLSPRVTLSGKVSGDAQNRLLKALAWAALRLTRCINEAEARWDPWFFNKKMCQNSRVVTLTPSVSLS